ncbi:monocarboxylate transporter 12-like [Amphiura filiformis]|uniref:monocarboxylate transporter 12-like n=1 Tax=Amphiura filiformis TaxID=82378 RepID=UPI003B21FE59
MPEPSVLPTRPTDGGWAWMVLLGSFLVRMLTEGFVASMGVFFVEWQSFFHASAASVAWAGSALTMAWFVSGPFVGALTIRFGCRKIVFLGGIVMIIAMVLSSFATEMWHLYVTMTIEGIGVGLAVQPTMVVLAYHFDKKLARVNGIAHAGVAIGIITLPPMFQLLIDNYGWQGTTLITAAYLGNICVSGALYRKPKYEYTVLRRRSTIESFKFEERERRASIRRESKARLPSVTSRKSISSLPGVKKTKKSVGRTCTTITDFFQLPLMKDNPRFLMMCVLSFCYAIGYTSATFYLVPRAVAVGISKIEASFLMSAMGICSLVARCTHGMLVDHGWISAAHLDAIAYAICGVASILSVFASDYITSIVFSVVYGTTSGVFNSLYPVVTKDFVGTEKLSDAIGVMHLILGIGSLLGVYFLGFFYDLTGSYEYSFYVSGVALLFCTALLLSQKWLLKCQKVHYDFSNEDSPAGGSTPPRSGSDSNGSEDGSDDVFDKVKPEKSSDSDDFIEIKVKPKIIPTDLKEIEKVRDDPSIKEVFDTYVPANKKSPNGYTKLNGAANGLTIKGPIPRHAITDYVYKPSAYHWIHKETPV